MDEKLPTHLESFEKTSATTPLQAQSDRPINAPQKPLAVVGLFAGIAGFEEGFRQDGHHTVLLCEADHVAQKILSQRFPDAHLAIDVRTLKALPECDVITAGFPCQDLSQAGKTGGIAGSQSSLIREVLRLLATVGQTTKWLIVENVPFMLHLHKGRAIREITDALNRLGWQWAYRTVDTRAFGLPQRRRRVFLLASRTSDPRAPLLGQSVSECRLTTRGTHACGFYWTEGHRGLGWAIDAIPPLKGGSGLAIPSPPAIWFPGERTIVIPSIEDAERLQGFAANWTLAANDEKSGSRVRWRLVGNAVSPPVAQWLAERLNDRSVYDASGDEIFQPNEPWPEAAWCVEGRLARSNVSSWPVHQEQLHLSSFLNHDLQPLSVRAASGFLSRLEHSCLRRDENFVRDLRRYVQAAVKQKAGKPADPTTSRRMARTKGKDNQAEIALRSALHRKGFRFRVHQKLVKNLRRTVDITFPSLKVAVFLDGCFWHGCPIHGTWPKTNAKWWRAKIEENRRRDDDTDRKLRVEGWTVVRIWEHEKVDVVIRRLEHLLLSKKSRQRKVNKKAP